MGEIVFNSSSFSLSLVAVVCVLSELLPCASAADPLYRLEHEKDDVRRAASRKTVLTRLTELKDAQSKDDYSANAFLRQKMRVRKRKDREKEVESEVKRGGWEAGR